MSPHVLAVGEALVDEVRRPDGSTAEHPGGSIANVALTLGRLGREVRLATWLGADPRGDLVRGWLAESGVGLVEGSDGAEHTSVAVATLDEGGSATYDFDLTWQVPAQALPGVDTSAEASAQVGGSSALAVHTGSIAAMLEPGATQVRQLLEAARTTSTTTYDPNARPAIMGSAVDVRPRVEALVQLSDVVKVSDEDLGWLYPDTDPVSVAREWQRGTPALVVVTFGGKGAVAVSDAGEVEAVAPRVEVVDTVGAGDSFMGALIDGLWEHDLLGADRRDALNAVGPATVQQVLDRCCTVAAITVSRAGANPPRRQEVGL
ncbi:carbohydrate kinase family protein [Promicromonospora soli]|uniref:Ribokinase n=1 Tax=Promicromonospora soli TaxID=2035533 RepID=A0A919KVT1_9MICO|nr:carbohydrate kinase [Promicromonospora soli]GHH73601.1 ribokinase [Promicromonospora soli]